MVHHNQFVIRNDRSRPLILNIEPEGVFFALEQGEEVTVFDVFAMVPVTVKLAESDSGSPVLSIWPGDGEVQVKKNGIDVLDLLQKEIGV